MLRGNWGVEDRIVLIILAAILVIGLGAPILLNWQNQQGKQHQGYRAPNETPIKAAPNSLWWHGKQPASYQSICDSPQERDDAELCQDWRQAQSAARGVELTQQQLWATWAGVVGLLVTIFLSIKANRNSAVSAEAAILAANAARDAVAADRAWITYLDPVQGIATNQHVTLLDGSIKHISTGYIFIPQWVNTGRSPAINVRGYGASKVITANENIPDFETAFIGMGVSKAVGETFLSLRCILDDNEFVGFRNRELIVILFSSIQYRDVFTNTDRNSTVKLKITHSGGTTRDASGNVQDAIFIEPLIQTLT